MLLQKIFCNLSFCHRSQLNWNSYMASQLSLEAILICELEDDKLLRAFLACLHATMTLVCKYHYRQSMLINLPIMRSGFRRSFGIHIGIGMLPASLVKRKCFGYRMSVLVFNMSTTLDSSCLEKWRRFSLLNLPVFLWIVNILRSSSQSLISLFIHYFNYYQLNLILNPTTHGYGILSTAGTA